MQLGQIELVPTGLQVREVDGLSPIEQDSIGTSLLILWQLWLTKDDLYILCRYETYIEGYAWDLRDERLADYLSYLRYTWQAEGLVQAYYYWASWRELHIYRYCTCRWVDNLNSYIAVHSLKYIKIDLVPFLLVSSQVDTLSDIQYFCTVASVVGIVDHVHAEANSLVGGQLYINISNLIVNHLIHQVEQLLWYYHSVVQTTWNLNDGLCCYIVLTTYSCTQSDGGQAFLLGSEVELRQLACVHEQRLRELVP